MVDLHCVCVCCVLVDLLFCCLFEFWVGVLLLAGLFALLNSFAFRIMLGSCLLFGMVTCWVFVLIVYLVGFG